MSEEADCSPARGEPGGGGAQLAAAPAPRQQRTERSGSGEPGQAGRAGTVRASEREGPGMGERGRGWASGAGVAGAGPGPRAPRGTLGDASVCGDPAELRERAFGPAAPAAGLPVPPVPEMRWDLLWFAPVGFGDLGIPGWSGTEKCNFNLHPDCRFLSL